MLMFVFSAQRRKPETGSARLIRIFPPFRENFYYFVRAPPSQPGPTQVCNKSTETTLSDCLAYRINPVGLGFTVADSPPGGCWSD